MISLVAVLAPSFFCATVGAPSRLEAVPCTAAPDAGEGSEEALHATLGAGSPLGGTRRSNSRNDALRKGAVRSRRGGHQPRREAREQSTHPECANCSLCALGVTDCHHPSSSRLGRVVKRVVRSSIDHATRPLRSSSRASSTADGSSRRSSLGSLSDLFRLGSRDDSESRSVSGSGSDGGAAAAHSSSVLPPPAPPPSKANGVGVGETSSLLSSGVVTREYALFERGGGAPPRSASELQEIEAARTKLRKGTANFFCGGLGRRCGCA